MRSRTNGFLPAMLVLFDRGSCCGHIDPYEIKAAMFGLEQVHLALPSDPDKKPYLTGASHGPGRKMTSTSNTSISAIGALWMSDAEHVHLDVYHNRYAAIPIQS
jgi:hypothetical protein